MSLSVASTRWVAPKPAAAVGVKGGRMQDASFTGIIKVRLTAVVCKCTEMSAATVQNTGLPFQLQALRKAYS